jgi:hypothetical protein
LVVSDIEIASLVTIIGTFVAFYGCAWLTSIDIPSLVTAIGKSAIDGCLSVRLIDIPSLVIATAGAFSFAGFSLLTDPFFGHNHH